MVGVPSSSVEQVLTAGSSRSVHSVGDLIEKDVEYILMDNILYEIGDIPW